MGAGAGNHKLERHVEGEGTMIGVAGPTTKIHITSQKGWEMEPDLQIFFWRCFGREHTLVLHWVVTSFLFVASDAAKMKK